MATSPSDRVADDMAREGMRRSVAIRVPSRVVRPCYVEVMSSLPAHVDVAIVGAGTSGAAAARYFAEQGASVLCVERRGLDEAGARWVNGVTRTALAEARIDLPRSAYFGAPHPFHLVTATGKVTIADHDVIDVDMR